MTGKSEHQNENNGNDAETVDGLVDLPLGTDKKSLQEAADAILKASVGKGDSDVEPADELGEETADPLTLLVNDLKTAHAEKDELNDQLLRSAAEMENLRRRTRKEISDAREFAISSFARDLLSVSDNLRRAMDAVPDQETEAETGGLKNLHEGVSMTERELHAVLERHKVKKMNAMGEKFDPNFHQAMFEIENKEVPNNSVIEVVQDGYVIGERMLRPAMVGVAKGGEKFAEPDPTTDETES